MARAASNSRRGTIPGLSVYKSKELQDNSGSLLLSPSSPDALHPMITTTD
jgi:hypothetical protein